MLYPGSRFRMADELLETYIRQLLEAQPGPRSDHRLAGRRADLDGSGFLQALDRAGRKIQKTRPDRAAHHPDQRHQDRRRMGGLLQAAQLPGRAERGRPAAAARCLPGEQGRLGHLRAGDARLAVPAEARGGRQHPVHGPCCQRRPPAGGLPLLPRRAESAVHAVHPHRRAGHAGDAAPGQPGLERARRRGPPAVHSRSASWSPSAR